MTMPSTNLDMTTGVDLDRPVPCAGTNVADCPTPAAWRGRTPCCALAWTFCDEHKVLAERQRTRYLVYCSGCGEHAGPVRWTAL